MAFLAISIHALLVSGACFSVSKAMPTVPRLSAGTFLHSSRNFFAQLKVGLEINLTGADHWKPQRLLLCFPLLHHAWNVLIVILTGVVLLMCFSLSTPIAWSHWDRSPSQPGLPCSCISTMASSSLATIAGSAHVAWDL